MGCSLTHKSRWRPIFSKRLHFGRSVVLVVPNHIFNAYNYQINKVLVFKFYLWHKIITLSTTTFVLPITCNRNVMPNGVHLSHSRQVAHVYMYYQLFDFKMADGDQLGQCRSSNMIYYVEMHRQTFEKLTWLKGTYYTSSNNKTLNARLLARVITGCHYT